MKTKIKWAFILMIVFAALGYGAGVAIEHFMGGKSIMEALTADLSLLLLGVCAGGGVFAGGNQAYRSNGK